MLHVILSPAEADSKTRRLRNSCAVFAGMYDSDEDVTAPARPVLGPAAPAWARNGSTATGPQSSSAFVAALNAANVAAVNALRSPVRDEDTAAKKEKHKRKKASSKKKAKQKHKRKRERDDG